MAIAPYTNTMTLSETSVIIAGAGPVGLGLACELGLRGIECMLIEKRDGAITVPKQSMVSSRNMEMCRRWGVAEEVRSAVWPESHPRDFVYLESLRGRELLRVRQPAFSQRELHDSFTPEQPCPCPQIYFDPILAQRARSFPNVTLSYGTRLNSFTQDSDSVIARLTDMATGVTRQVRARYLVGCDGPAGFIRQSFGIELDGAGAVAQSLNLYFRSEELCRSHDKGWARFYRVIDESGCWAELIPIDGKELWRLTVFDQPASLEDPDHLLRKMLGGPFRFEMLDVSPWERRDFVAQHYGEGRVFIAGDAAHECSPTGGIGMHTGLEEAVNLGWKLAAVIEGWGGPQLLASYESERRPIAIRNVGFATRSFRAIADVPGCTDSNEPLPWQQNPPRWLSVAEHLKLQYCYEDSPICVPDGSPAPEAEGLRFVPSTRPGSRAPHAWLSNGRSTLDLFGEGFVLVRSGPEPREVEALTSAAKAGGMPLRVEPITDPAIASLYEQPLVLVRPDGHVAWRGTTITRDVGMILDRVRGA